MLLLILNASPLLAGTAIFDIWVDKVKPNWKVTYHSNNQKRVHFIFENITSLETVSVSIYDLGSEEKSLAEWNRKLGAHLGAESPNGIRFNVSISKDEGFFDTESDTHIGRFYIKGRYFAFIHILDVSKAHILPKFYGLFEDTLKKKI